MLRQEKSPKQGGLEICMAKTKPHHDWQGFYMFSLKTNQEGGDLVVAIQSSRSLAERLSQPP